MVKINKDCDHIKDKVRNERVKKCYEIIKNSKKSSSPIYEDKLKLDNIDLLFYYDFRKSSNIIKDELLYLWEKLGELLENEDNEVLNKKDECLHKKRKYIFGP